MDPGKFVHVEMGTQSSLPFASPCEVTLLRQVQQVQTAIDGDETEFVMLDTRLNLVRYFSFEKFRPVTKQNNLVLLVRKDS